MKNFGVYIHIPFCVGKCNYCSFISKKASSLEIGNYVSFLINEIKENASKYKQNIITSIYFGGGTPSLISAGLIQKILTTIKNNFNVSENAEISIECNPCSFTKFKANKYFNIGINRISFGVQSLNNKELKILGRKHTKNIAINAIKIAKDVGFKNISCDLMIGIPNQTVQNLINSANELIGLGITHISAYMLMLEEGTPLCRSVKKGNLTIANDDECVDMYNKLVDILKQKNINRYEISNFAKKGFECKHNLNYWQMGEYVGFGVASHSFVNGIRFNNSNNFNNYYNAQIQQEKLTQNQIIEETIMLGLRTIDGVNINTLKNLGYDILKQKQQQINFLIKNNLIKLKNNYICLTNKGFGLCNSIVLELI